MIIDDDPEVLRVHARMIELMGHAFTAFECSEKAFQYLREEVDAVDLLITDYHMPIFNGLELIVRLRENGADFPSIILTAFPEEIDTEVARNCNARVVGKPARLRELIGLINSNASE